MSDGEHWALLALIFVALVLGFDLLVYPEQRRRARRQLCKLRRRACRLGGCSGRS